MINAVHRGLNLRPMRQRSQPGRGRRDVDVVRLLGLQQAGISQRGNTPYPSRRPAMPAHLENVRSTIRFSCTVTHLRPNVPTRRTRRTPRPRPRTTAIEQAAPDHPPRADCRRDCWARSGRAAWGNFKRNRNLHFAVCDLLFAQHPAKNPPTGAPVAPAARQTGVEAVHAECRRAIDNRIALPCHNPHQRCRSAHPPHARAG